MPLAHPEQAAIVSSSADLQRPGRATDAWGRAGRYRRGGFGPRGAGPSSPNSVAEHSCCPREFVVGNSTAWSRRAGGTGAPTGGRQRGVPRPTCPTLVGGPDRSAAASRPARISATTSPSIPRSGWPAGRALATVCCSTFATRRTRCGSPRSRIPTSPTGIRPLSTTTAPRSSSRMSGAVAGRRSAARPTRWSGAPTRSSRIENGKMVFQSYYKMPAAQTSLENCVAHNGSLIPIPGRDVMVQAWYQGGVSVFDWTDAAHPKEIAFFDRGPVDSTHFTMGGVLVGRTGTTGVIVSSEIARGLDVFELTPSAFISQNEIDAAKTVQFDQLNVQDQQKFSLAGELRAARGRTSTSSSVQAGWRPTRLPARAPHSPVRNGLRARRAVTRWHSSRPGCMATPGVPRRRTWPRRTHWPVRWESWRRCRTEAGGRTGSRSDQRSTSSIGVVTRMAASDGGHSCVCALSCGRPCWAWSSALLSLRWSPPAAPPPSAWR